MKKPAIGHVACSVCPFPDAEVKEDKNGYAYVSCPDCTTQTFTRDKPRDRMLRARMRPVAVPEDLAPPPASTVPAPGTVAVPPAPPEPDPPAPPTPTPKAKAARNWLTPLLAGGTEK